MTKAARRHLAEAFDITPYLSVRDRPTARALAGRLNLSAPQGAGRASTSHRPSCGPGRPSACAAGMPDRRPDRTSGR